MMHPISMILTVSLLAVGLAEAQEVDNPWASNSAGPPSSPTARGDHVALQPLGGAVPAWALHEVVNPWAAPNPAHRFRPPERRLSIAARARASRIAGCFPAEHSHERHWTELNAPAARGQAPGAGGELSQCLRRVMNELRPSSSVFVLALRFDEQGLRDIYVMNKNRM